MQCFNKNFPAPFFASLFLCYYESRCIKDLQKKDLIKAIKSCNLFYFIDDLNAVDDIFSEEIELCRRSGNNTEKTFFDLVNKVKNNKFQTGLFEKRDIFPFNIVEMLKISRNTSSNILYTSIDVEFLRIARAVVNLVQEIKTPLQYLLYRICYGLCL